MKTSDDGVKLIQLFEGLRLTSYVCPAGILTIGYGHTSAAGNPIVKPKMTITKDEAADILRSDLSRFERGVEGMVKVDISQNQFDVLVSFAYNCGLGALKKSTLLKRVNAKRFDEVPAELMKWSKAGGRQLAGLVRRRRAECELWRSITGGEPDGSRVQPDQPVASKSIAQSKEANAAAIAGGASLIAIGNDLVPLVQGASNAAAVASEALGRPIVILGIVILLASIGIWYWRKRRLDEEGA